MSNPVPLDTQSPLPCPKCAKLFRLPDGFTTSHALACPHCEEQVTGQQIMEAMAPTAKMVSAPTATAQSGARPTRSFDEQDFVIPKPLKTAVRRRRSLPERVGSDSGDEKESSSSQRSRSSSSSSSSRSRKGKSSKKKEVSTVGEIFKIALGGLLALPIAQVVIWWLFAADPLSLAEPTSKFASFLVPPKLQPPAKIEDLEEEHDKDMPANQKMHDDTVPFRINPGG